MLDKLLLLLSFHGFLQGILEGDAVLIGSFKHRYHLLSTFDLHLHLLAYSLKILLEYLERLVKTCRGHSQRVILLLTVEAGLEKAADTYTVVKLYSTFF